MKTVLIVGAGNIGFRHFQATCTTPGVDRVLVVEPSAERRLLVKNSREAALKTVEILESLPERNATGPLAALISAVTTDVQTSLLGKYFALAPEFILLEKPVAQNLRELSELRDNAHAHGRVYVNCARNLGAGVAKVRETFVGKRMHLEVFGENWGYGCNLVHFVELFRHLTESARIDPKTAEIAVSPTPNKRGSRYEEFLGTASFSNEKGDTLNVTCGSSTPETTGITLVVKDRSNDSVRYLLQEKTRAITDLSNGTTSPLGDLFVSESTRVILERAFHGEFDRIEIPNFEQAFVSHSATLGAFSLALGRDSFRIT